ncbi:hypothetical protein QYF36_010985 [Acer negundo]|nr:hypothetical protein QYF36_010985 [Acer negundo]
MMEFCAMEEISANSIVIYIRYLYGILKQNKLFDKFVFVDPNHIVYSVGSKEERARSLNKRLGQTKPGQLFLAPYNHICVFFFDPLGGDIRLDIKEVVKMALKLFVVNIGKCIRKNPSWQKIVCPKQPGNIECGYYVLRYLREITSNPKSLNYIYFFRGKSTYTRHDIDII